MAGLNQGDEGEHGFEGKEQDEHADELGCHPLSHLLALPEKALARLLDSLIIDDDHHRDYRSSQQRR